MVVADLAGWRVGDDAIDFLSAHHVSARPFDERSII